MAITYKNSADTITLEEAQRIYEQERVCVIVNDGAHVTLDDEF